MKENQTDDTDAEKVVLTPQEFARYLRLREHGHLNKRQITEIVELYKEYAPYYDHCPKGIISDKQREYLRRATRKKRAQPKK